MLKELNVPTPDVPIEDSMSHLPDLTHISFPSSKCSIFNSQLSNFPFPSCSIQIYICPYDSTMSILSRFFSLFASPTYILVLIRHYYHFHLSLASLSPSSSLFSVLQFSRMFYFCFRDFKTSKCYVNATQIYNKRQRSLTFLTLFKVLVVQLKV